MATRNSVAKSLLGKVKSVPTKRELIRRESQIGGQLFGAIPQGHRREFFCLDQHTWVWHEEWTDAAGKPQILTTRYEITPRGVLKAQDGQQYQYVRGHEATTFKQAVSAYYQQVSKHVYGVTV